MDETLVKLEEIRAEIVGESFEDQEAVRYLDALAWWLAERENRKNREREVHLHQS